LLLIDLADSIISARKATRAERKDYEENSNSQKSAGQRRLVAGIPVRLFEGETEPLCSGDAGRDNRGCARDDVAEIFKSAKTVNAALRSVISGTRKPTGKRTR